MEKLFLVCLAFKVCCVQTFSQPTSSEGPPRKTHGRLSVSKQDPLFLRYVDGTPFFWLGDTGWELIHLLKHEEVKYYFKIRRQQGFNEIQTVALSEFGGLSKPNAYGALPFINKDPSQLAITPGKDVDKKMNTIIGIM